MMKYLSNNSELFSGIIGPFIIALMQFLGAILTEIINILTICSLPDIMSVIMNFIALGAIAEIDNYYLGALSHCPLKCAVEKPIKVPFKKEEVERGCKAKMVYVVYRILRSF